MFLRCTVKQENFLQNHEQDSLYHYHPIAVEPLPQYPPFKLYGTISVLMTMSEITWQLRAWSKGV